MKTILLTLMFASLSITLTSQNTSKIQKELHTDLTSDNIVINISSTKNSLKEIQLHIFDLKNEKLRVINLPNADKNINVSISITDLQFGSYFYTITQNSTELYNGTFLRDWFDADLIN